MTPSTVQSVASIRRAAWSGPGFWVLAWAVYTLSMLAWLGYRDAWLGTLCLAPR